MTFIQLRDLQKNEREVPIITNKILLDLANLIHVNDDLISFRQKQGLFGQVFDSLTGADRKRQLAIDKNVNVAMQSFHDLVLDIADNWNVSNNVIITIKEKLIEIEEELIEIEEELIETRQAIRNHREEINLLKDMVNQFQYRVENHDHRILNLEHRAERKDVDIKIITAIAAWQSGSTYQGFYWAIQVAFVIREIVDYALSDYERLTSKGKDKQLRQNIIDQILAANKTIADKTIPDHYFRLTNLLNLSYDKTSPENRELAGYLLEVESMSQQRIAKTPYLFTLGKTLELAQQQHQDSAKAAFELCLSYPNARIYAATSKREFVERIVNETASDRLNFITLVES
jgi:hypothetical protein